jgi:heme/copper-type cytochrome/quinol oxidase subunit 1
MSPVDIVFIMTGAAIILVGVALLFLDRAPVTGWFILKPLSGNAGPGGPAH